MENIRSSKDVPPIPNKEEQKQVPKIKLIRPESQCDDKKMIHSNPKNHKKHNNRVRMSQRNILEYMVAQRKYNDTGILQEPPESGLAGSDCGTGLGDDYERGTDLNVKSDYLELDDFERGTDLSVKGEFRRGTNRNENKLPTEEQRDCTTEKFCSSLHVPLRDNYTKGVGSDVYKALDSLIRPVI